MARGERKVKTNERKKGKNRKNMAKGQRRFLKKKEKSCSCLYYSFWILFMFLNSLLSSFLILGPMKHLMFHCLLQHKLQLTSTSRHLTNQMTSLSNRRRAIGSKCKSILTNEDILFIFAEVLRHSRNLKILGHGTVESY